MVEKGKFQLPNGTVLSVPSTLRISTIERIDNLLRQGFLPRYGFNKDGLLYFYVYHPETKAVRVVSRAVSSEAAKFYIKICEEYGWRRKKDG